LRRASLEFLHLSGTDADIAEPHVDLAEAYRLPGKLLDGISVRDVLSRDKDLRPEFATDLCHNLQCRRVACSKYEF
jgi:hypothetical protein